MSLYQRVYKKDLKSIFFTKSIISYLINLKEDGKVFKIRRMCVENLILQNGKIFIANPLSWPIINRFSNRESPLPAMRRNQLTATNNTAQHYTLLEQLQSINYNAVTLLLSQIDMGKLYSRIVPKYLPMHVKYQARSSKCQVTRST